MAYVYTIDSGSPINCPYGRVLAGNTVKWTPHNFTCGVQTSSMLNLDNRLHIVCCSGATVNLSGVTVSSDSLIVVDGC